MDYGCSGLEIVNAEQALHVKVAAEPGILQRVDDHRYATPRRGGGVDQLPHDWDDEAAIRILTNCRTAMAPAGKVLLVEIVIPKDTADSDAALTRRCWSSPAAGNAEGEYRDLLRRAG